MTDSYLYSYVTIRNGTISANGKKIGKFPSELTSFLAAAYQFLQPDYLKFFKMDASSKLGFLAAEVLLAHSPDIKELPPDQVALVLSTGNGSLESDERFQKSIEKEENWFPSPSVFVYTLPNIVLGEISIRFGFKGENMCLVSEQFSAEQVCLPVISWLQSGTATVCLCGWLEVQGSQCVAFLAMVGTDEKKSISKFEPATIGQYFPFVNIVV